MIKNLKKQIFYTPRGINMKPVEALVHYLKSKTPKELLDDIKSDVKIDIIEFKECLNDYDFWILDKGEGLVRGDRRGLTLIAKDLKEFGFPFQTLMFKENGKEIYAIKMQKADYRSYVEQEEKRYKDINTRD